MSYVIKTAKTVDEAVRQALEELKLTKTEVEIEVIEEASRGFLGIGAKDATVKISKIENTQDLLREIFSDKPEKSQKKPEKDKIETKFKEQEKVEVKEENPVQVNRSQEIKSVETEVKKETETRPVEELAKEFMDKFMATLSISYELKIEKKENILLVDILGNEKELGIVIGKRGVTLDSIQYLLSLIVNKNSDEYIRTIVDSSGYRKKREETLRNLARKMAAKTLKINRSIRLEPMNAAERKIIHEELQGYEGVITHSEGKDPFRKVVIKKERKY